VALHFPSSLRFTWTADARLIIRNWHGSTNGGGQHQVILGFNASGLAGQQLAQIRFRDPAGLKAGDYSARILSTGEIVPVPRPPVSYSRNKNQLVFNWPAGWTLQTVTNIAGPFSDVNASSPYTSSSTSAAQRYFRPRQ